MAKWLNKIQGSGRNDTLVGTSGADEIYGNGGNDILDGAGAGDFLYGQEGDDILLASATDSSGDLYDGGNGVDTFKIEGSSMQNVAFTVNLLTGRDQQGDRFTAIENVIGGNLGDTILDRPATTGSRAAMAMTSSPAAAEPTRCWRRRRSCSRRRPWRGCPDGRCRRGPGDLRQLVGCGDRQPPGRNGIRWRRPGRHAVRHRELSSARPLPTR